ncbi:MAG: protein kinase, partial [candidate division Zixibacteria bacterium]|nr:protein kinase [candidate division Zixibacteria bacterium]
MIGTTVAQYKILKQLGQGGMGIVYLAEDAKLGRKVALKFLPPHLSASEQDRARFLQEARAASALNHPNVCTVHDIQDTDGQIFLVMEYVDGTTLRDRTQPYSVKQVVEIGIQIADGLAAAHEQGIVHRDIKTENVMVRRDGIVQIMDFGLAKLRGVSRLTKEGSTLGTIGYMSPEQVQGLDTDHRTDIFSLGVVLYELLAGQMPYQGAHETAIMYEIVNVDPPPLSAVRPDIDPELDRIVLECLQKDPDERCQSAKEVSRDLRRFKVDSGRKRVSRVSTVRPIQPVSLRGTSSPGNGDAEVTSISPPRRASRTPILIAWPVAAVALIALAVAQLTGSSSVPATERAVRFSVETPNGQDLEAIGSASLALSPDGQRLAIVAVDSSTNSHIWIRSLDAFAPRLLPGTENASFPFWSPDNRFIGFFADRKLKKIDVTGGPPLTICDAIDGRSGSWNKSGIIIFSPDATGGLSRVAASGGIPVAITRLDSARVETTHRWPWFLPDGNRFLYYARSGGSGSDPRDAIFIGSLDSSVNRRLVSHHGNALYARDHLLFVREGTLMAQRFDPEKLELSGEPFPVGENVVHDSRYTNDVFTASSDGALAYRIGSGG